MCFRGTWEAFSPLFSLTSSCRVGFPSFITQDRYRLFFLMHSTTGILLLFSSPCTKLMQNTTRERKGALWSGMHGHAGLAQQLDPKPRSPTINIICGNPRWASNGLTDRIIWLLTDSTTVSQLIHIFSKEGLQGLLKASSQWQWRIRGSHFLKPKKGSHFVTGQWCAHLYGQNNLISVQGRKRGRSGLPKESRHRSVSGTRNNRWEELRRGKA